MIELASAGWALALPPPGRALTSAAAAAVRDLAAAGPGLPPDAPFILVRAGRIDERLGPAVLVARPGRAVLYCPGGDITDVAARGLAALACGAAVMPWPGRGPGVPGLRVARTPHPRLPGCLHPAYIRAPRPGGRAGVTVHVCANLISAELAAVISALCTAYARIRLPAAHCAVPGPRPGTLPAGPPATSPGRGCCLPHIRLPQYVRFITGRSLADDDRRAGPPAAAEGAPWREPVPAGTTGSLPP